MNTAPDILRRIDACDLAGQPLDPSDIAWLAKAARAHLASPASVRFDVQLGVHPIRGASGWWTREVRADRNAVLVEMDRKLFADLDVAASARNIVALAHARRRRPDMTLSAAETQLLAMISGTGGAVPSARQVQNIIQSARGNSLPAQITRHALPDLKADTHSQ